MKPSSFTSSRSPLAARNRRPAAPHPLAASLARFGSIAAVCGALSLAAAQRSAAAPAAWDVDTLTDGILTSGSGVWDNLALNFTNLADTIPHFAWDNVANAGDAAFFGGTGGTAPFTITVGTITAAGVTFGTPGYLLTGGTLTMGGGTVDATVDGRINSVITGAGGLIKEGVGTLTLGGANTFTGQFQINTGKVLLSGLGVGAVAGGGVGNETIVATGATLDLGGQAYGNQVPTSATAEIFQIQGTGVGGIGALVNSGANQNNATSKIVLTGDATVNAGGGISVSFNAGGNVLTQPGGRFDVRNSAAPTAGQKHLDLAGFTLTKIGNSQMALVNADISAGNIVVNEGQLYFEAGTIAGSGVNVTVNPNGKFGWWNIGTGVNITAPVLVNGGTVGDIASTSASQTVLAPITITGAVNPSFVANANTTTLAGLVSEDGGSTITEFAKRGGATLALSNAANSFDAPITIYAGTLQGNFTPAFVGGVFPAAPVALSGTPLGTDGTVKLAGGTLAIRVDGANDATNQVFTIGKTLTVNNAPGGINLDRLTATGGTDKNLQIAVTFAAPSAANGYSIGQNQLTGTQTNGFRSQFTTLAMNSDTVLNAGDFTLTGSVTSLNRNSLVHIGGNSWGFIGGATQQFNATFNLGAANLRIGSMFGTGVTDDTINAGTGTIYNAPNAALAFRSPTNIAAGQAFEVVSQRVAQSTVNFQNFTAVPAAMRATGGGVLGVGSAAGFGNLDLSKIGDGTFRIGSGFGGTGNGTVTGVITAGAGGVVRAGAGGTTTISGTDRVTGSSVLEVGSDLINGGFRTSGTGGAQNGTVVLTGANNYSGGTTVNRSSTLSLQALDAVGAGSIQAFGTLTIEGAAGSLTADGLTNTNTVTTNPGSTILLQNSALTGTTDFNRWGDDVGVALNASTLTLNSRNNNASTTLEKIGAVTYAGGSVININRQNAVAGNNVELDVDSLTRVASGTLEIVRSTGTGANFGTANILKAVGTAPTTIALSAGTMLAPHLTVVDGTRLVNFANYGATGIVNAVPTNTVNTAAFTAGLNTGNQYVYVDFAAAALTSTLADNPDVAALKVGAGQAAASATTIANGAGTSIRIRTGGLIISGDTTSGFYSNAGGTQATINPAINFNDGASNIEGLVNVRAATTGILNGVITAAGLTKFGGGTLNITANNGATLSGTVSINAGTLQLFGPTTTSTYNVGGSGGLLLNGGQLNLRSNNSAVSGTINTTQQIPVTVAANISIATIDLNRSGADTASSGTFIFLPAVASPGLTLQGSPGTQGQTLTVSGANYNLTFGATAQNSFTGNITINTIGGRTLQVRNAPTLNGIAPVITKSGDGTWIVGDAAGVTSAPVGTQIVLNAGTLDPRSIQTFGPVTSSSFVLNGGQLNLRRDSSAVWSGNTIGSGPGYNVAVNGSATISVDRVGTTQSNFRLGLGKLTSNTNGTLTVNNGNGYGADFQGAQINGRIVIASNVAAGTQETAAHFLSGFDVSGGSLVKSGTGHLHLSNTNNSYDGGTYVQQGILRLRGFSTAGTGNIWVNPGATLDFNSNSNLNGSQQVFVRSNGAFIPMLSVNSDFVTHPTTEVDATAAPIGIVGLSNSPTGTYDTPIDLSALYGGGWSLGGVSAGAYDPRYTASTLTPGNGNLYRLGGGGTSMAIGHDAAGTAHTNLLTGPNNVRLGFDSGNILPANATNFQYAIAGNNDYSGGSTVIHRGMVAKIFEAPDLGNNLTALSNSAVNVFGVLSLSGNSSLVNSTATGNINAVTLHPGSALFLDNNNGGVGAATAFAAANIADRLYDGAPIALNGALINLIGANTAISSETLGDVTYSRGARLRAQLTGAGGTATLTLNNLFGAGPGNTLTLATSAAGTLGAGDKIIVAFSPPAPVNGMVSPSIVNLSDNTFVTHGVNGFQNITYNKTLNATYTPGTLLTTDKVDVITAALTLQDNPVIYALRTSQNINISAFNTITLRSGGLIGTGGTIAPHLVFNDGTSNIEARIFVTNTVAINGTLTANGITKFGAGNLTINVPQPNYASGWTVNSGTLQINDAQGLGQSVPGNAVTLNGSLTTGGSLPQSFGSQTLLNFNRDYGTPELYTFSGGPITVVNEATIRIGAGVNDRVLKIPEVFLDSTGADSSVALTIDVPNQRHRGIIPTLTLQDNAIVRVYDLGSQADTGRVTAAVIESLVGSGRNLQKIGNRTLELPGDNSATFTGGSIIVSQGTVRVRNNGSLGNATTATTIERNATLEIDTPNFTAPGTVNQLPGSIERWNREDARTTGIYNLPTGVNLQLNTNLSAGRTIGLDGGTIEGFLWTDHPAPAVERTIGSAVTINLLNNSYVGQNILQGQGYDAGRAPTVGLPFGDNITGAFLRIEGKFTGPFDLTKTGLDTVTLANSANSYNNTIVEMGVLRGGTTNALPTSGVLTTRNGGAFDLFGFDQAVSGLGTLTAGPNPGGVGLGSAGRILNSGVTDATLTVAASSDFTYNGSIELNVALLKADSGTLTLGNGASTYRGATTIIGGILSVANLANGGSSSSIGAASSLASNLVLHNGTTLRYTGGDSTTNRAFTLNSGVATIEVTSAASTLTVDAAGTGNGGLTKTGDGTLALAEQNTYFGNTLVVAGTLSLADFNALAISTLDTGTDGSQTVTFNAPGTGTYNLGGLKGDDDLAVGGGNNALVVGANNQSTAFNGDISGSLFLTKTGSGKLELNGVQDYATLNTVSGRTDLNNTLGTGTSTINADAQTNITVSQTLAALNIGTGAVVTLGNPPPPALDGDGDAFAVASPEFGEAGAAALAGGVVESVPEPGSAALLLTGMLAMLGRRRRRAEKHSA